jgi:hypothetical protein
LELIERQSRWLSKLVLAVTAAAIVSALSAQISHQPHVRVGLPQDWSHSHLIFNRNALFAHPELAQNEPRVLHAWLRQSVLPFRQNPSVLASSSSAENEDHRDWSFALGTARVAAGMSPAKYGFDTLAAPSCTNDFVVFGLNLAGSATQANLVALNQLYRGTGGLCGTGAPSVLFAYNTSTAGGRIATSPIISLDGTKIAFVESTGTSSIFHVLTWAPGGTLTSPAAPASMVSITYAAATNTRSSPWIDFNTDTIYVGTNNGRLYKFTGVFLGTPALAGSPWPAVVSAGRTLTGPVLDHATGNLFLGDTGGTLFSVSSTTAIVVNSLVVGSTTAPSGGGIVDSPIVDSSNGLIYAESSNDNTSAVLVQATTANLTQLARARIGMGSTGGTNVPLYDGTIDNNYFNSPSSGTFMACGTGAADTSPWLYTFSFAANNTLNTTPVSSAPLLTSTLARCSPITEFFNPNVSGGTDFFFFGLTRDCFPPSTAGCIVSRQTPGASPLPVREGGGTSSIIVDNQSTAGQASSIYFTNLASPGNAVKLTQNGLQ